MLQPTSATNRTVAYILSDMRSGSTLLDQLLGTHPDIASLGELHWLPAYVTQDRRIYDPDHELVCTCMHPVADCLFWSEVARCLNVQMDALRLRVPFTRTQKRILTRYPGVFRRRFIQRATAGHQVADDNLALIDCLFRVSGCSVLVDSSKSTYRFRLIHDIRPAHTRGLILTRDYRAVVHSKMKRGHSLEAAAKGWLTKMREIAALTGDLPNNHVHRLRYEDLCRDPVSELARLCEFLGLAFTPVMLERPVAGTHHIGGSPSKFDRTRTTISMDTTYKNAFSAIELARLADLVGDSAAEWGY